MKKNMTIAIFLIIAMLVGNVGFAIEGPIIEEPTFENVSLSSKQEILFTLEDTDIKAPSDIRDLGYDKENGHLYFILKEQENGDEEPSQEEGVDPVTGLQIDPVSRFLIDPISGLFVDPISGEFVDLETFTPIEPVIYYPINPLTGTLVNPYSGEDSFLPFPENAFAGFPRNPADPTGIIDPISGFSVDPKTGALYIENGPLLGYYTMFPSSPLSPTGILMSPLYGAVNEIVGLMIYNGMPNLLVDPEMQFFVDATTGIHLGVDEIAIVPNQWYPWNPQTGAPQNPETGVQDLLEEVSQGNQRVYTLDGEFVENPAYPIIEEMERKGIEFEAGNTWSVDKKDESSVILTNHDESIEQEISLEAKGFAIQDDQVVYYMGCIQYSIQEFIQAKTDPAIAENSIDSELSFVKAYDLSPDGSELIFAGGYYDDDMFPENETSYLVRYDLENERVIEEYLIADAAINEEEGHYSDVTDLYTTEDYIVLVRKDAGEMKGYIERYDYEGNLLDRITTNYCVRKITEGLDGSTIYVQLKYPATDKNFMGKLIGDLEVIQINWDGKASSNATSAGRMKPVIKERTRVGQTIARFTDSQFGLFHVEDPETGIMDFRAPVRSAENLVKLQISYGDVAAKIASGARNLIVEYKGQFIEIPMSVFDCSELLATMACQDDATIEIILQADEAGNVTYSIQLFVVEQVNAMTRVVHRKTIQ